MKINLFILLFLAFSARLWAQEGPVAVDDYAQSALGETITINVTANDYHPEGLNFRIAAASNAQSFTDSTITYFLDFDRYYGYPDTIVFYYILVDDIGLSGFNALSYVYLIIDNHRFYSQLDLNNIEASVQANGIQFWPPAYFSPENYEHQPVMFEFPKGGGNNTIFSSSLWIGGLDEIDSLKTTGELYNWQGLDFWPGPLSSNSTDLSIEPETVIEWHKVWKLGKEEIAYHKQHYGDDGYEMIENIATWPAHGDQQLHQSNELAPFVDIAGDGIYQPAEGDYPLIRGDQCIYYILNDVKPHVSSQGEALGLEMHVMAYAFYQDGSSPLDNTLFYSYKIHNRSSHTYHDTYVGIFGEIDIGSCYDDFVGCDVGRSAYFGYNGDDYDEDGFGDNPPAQAIVLLGGPLMDGNGIDDAIGECDESINGIGFGDGISDNERFGMSGFTSLLTKDSASFEGCPEKDYEFYNYLNSLWKDGSSIEYGGNGNAVTGSYGPSTKFMFPGLSDPCNWGTGGLQPNGPVNWTEITAGHEPEDSKGLGIMGPFTFEPGTMERIDVAYVASFADPGETAVETLMRSVDEVRAKYLENPTYFGYQWLGMEENQIDPIENKLIVFPNPVTNKLTFSCYGKDGEVNYRLTNMMGKTEMRGQIDNNESHTLDVSALSPGIYILSITSKNGHSVAKVIKQ